MSQDQIWFGMGAGKCVCKEIVFYPQFTLEMVIRLSFLNIFGRNLTIFLDKSQLYLILSPKGGKYQIMRR